MPSAVPDSPLSDGPAPEPGWLDDLALRARLVRGEAGAADELLARTLDDVYAFVHHRVGADRARAEDVVQETFLTGLERIASYAGDASLATWLCGIARNKLHAARRDDARGGRARSLEDALASADPEIDRILAEVAREEIPEALLEREETRTLVGATLSSLPPEYRRALLAKYVDGASVDEIAVREKKSAKAAESTLTRARVAFARVFELLAKRRGGVA